MESENKMFFAVLCVVFLFVRLQQDVIQFLIKTYLIFCLDGKCYILRLKIKKSGGDLDLVQYFTSDYDFNSYTQRTRLMMWDHQNRLIYFCISQILESAVQ
jgi:hypothetical protein